MKWEKSVKGGGLGREEEAQTHELVAGPQAEIIQSLSFGLIDDVVGVVLSSLLLQTDASVDEVQALLDLGRDWWWCWQVVAADSESLLIGLVLDIDQLKPRGER
jgi:hypothetical protein